LLRFHGLTDVGQKRTQNEDCFAVAGDEQYALLADGMGGRLYGEVASSMAVDIIGRHIREDMPASIRRLEKSEQAVMAVNLMDEWIRNANTAIYNKGIEDERYQEMGTTLVAALALDRQLVLAHVGDSRAYRYAGGRLSQLTDDHSYVNSQVKSGLLTEEEARESTQRNIITRAMGTAGKVKPDFRIHLYSPNERFLFCSDGLTDMIPDEEMSSILERDLDLERTAESLVSAANAAGGADNITVILAEATDG